jgi:hypothetical protein
MSYFSQLGLGSSGTGYAGGWRKGDVADYASERILCVGKIKEGEIHYDISPLPAQEETPLEPLQNVIDEAAELAEYQDYMADVEFWRTGC